MPRGLAVETLGMSVMAIGVGLVAVGGLGREFRLNMSYFKYDEVALLLLCYFILVVFADMVSVGLRGLAS